MKTSVTSTKKRAQNPAHERNDQRPENCAPKTGHFETNQNLAHEFQHQRVDDQNENAEGDKNQREAQQEKNRANKGIDDAEEERRAEQTGEAATVIKTDDRRRHKDREGRQRPAKNKISHR